MKKTNKKIKALKSKTSSSTRRESEISINFPFLPSYLNHQEIAEVFLILNRPPLSEPSLRSYSFGFWMKWVDSGLLTQAKWHGVHATEWVHLIREFICLSCTRIYQITLSDHSPASDLFLLCSSSLHTSKQLTSQRTGEHIIILICLNVTKMAAFQLTFWKWWKVGVI